MSYVNSRESEPPPSEGVSHDTLYLARQAQGGETEALNELFERYSERLHGLARPRMGPELRRHVDSVDMTQDALLEAARSFEFLELRTKKALMVFDVLLPFFHEILEDFLRIFLPRHPKCEYPY